MKTYLLLFISFIAFNAISQNGNEREIYSFVTENDKLMTLNIDTLKNELICRYGNSQSSELEIRDNLNDSIVIFTYTYYLRGGGIENEGLDLNYLTFNNGNDTYTIYSEYSAEGNSTVIGIKILNKQSGEEHDIAGLIETESGSLISFRHILAIREDF